MGGSGGGDSFDGCLARQTHREKPRRDGIRAAAFGSLKQQKEAVAGLVPESVGDTSWGTPTQYLAGGGDSGSESGILHLLV